MKKLLLGSTALVGAAALASAAHAGGEPGTGLNITVGGHIDFQAGILDDDILNATTGGANSARELNFQNDTEIHIKVEGMSENGLKYGAVIELEADVDGDDKEENISGSNDGATDKTYIFVESSAGRVELGANVGAATTLKVDASTIARATGGIDGDFVDYLQGGGLTGGGATYIVTPDLPLDSGVATNPASLNQGVNEDSNKITYYTPVFNGFQAGVSYLPDSGETGSLVGGPEGDADAFEFENVLDLGLNYSGSFEGVDLAVSATGQFGSAETAAGEDLQAYAIGASAGFQGFSVAGSWADADDTFGTNSDGKFWNLGAAYETGPFGVSVTYFDSELNDDEFTNIVVGADYQLAPGLVPYVEVSFFDADEDGATAGDNEGSVVLVGAELTF